MCHEEHGGVTVVFQNGGQTGIDGYVRPLHGVAEHDRRKGVKRGIETMVGVIARRIKVGKTQRTAVERVEAGREVLFVAEVRHQFGRHRLHYDHDYVLMRGRSLRDDSAGDGRDAVNAFTAQQQAGTAHSLVAIHEPERFVFRPQPVKRTGQKAEHRVEAHVVEYGTGGEIGCAHLDGIVAQAAAYAHEAKGGKNGRTHYHI